MTKSFSESSTSQTLLWEKHTGNRRVRSCCPQELCPACGCCSLLSPKYPTWAQYTRARNCNQVGGRTCTIQMWCTTNSGVCHETVKAPAVIQDTFSSYPLYSLFQQDKELNSCSCFISVRPLPEQCQRLFKREDIDTRNWRIAGIIKKGKEKIYWMGQEADILNREQKTEGNRWRIQVQTIFFLSWSAKGYFPYEKNTLECASDCQSISQVSHWCLNPAICRKIFLFLSKKSNQDKMLCQGSTTAVQVHPAQLTTTESGILFRLCYLQVRSSSSKIKKKWI